MAGSQIPGPLGILAGATSIAYGLLARMEDLPPGPTGIHTRVLAVAESADSSTSKASGGGQSTLQLDTEIEALNLSEKARKAAYALKKAHPSITFTSGRRDKNAQARAMAGNVVKNRKWIGQTYKNSTLSKKCQEWVDKNPTKKSQAEIQAGLLAIFNAATDAELGALSKHLSGNAFDVQPVDKNADAIKKTIRNLPGIDKFLDSEGGLVRWHAQF